MTLARTALRLAAVNSLMGSDANSGPTIAANRVYDSRITDFTPETFGEDARPAIIVMTDSDEGDQLSRQNGGPPFHRLIDLVFELAMIETVKDGSDFVLSYPDTDARLEAALEVLEFQIARRLGYDPDASAVLFRKFVRPKKHECHRQVLDAAGVKIASRILTWTCEVNDDQVQIYKSDDVVPTGIEALPEPLKSVVAGMMAGSSGADVGNAIASALSSLTVGPLLGFDMTADNTQGEDASDMLDVSVEIRSALDVPQVVASAASVTVDYAKGTFQRLILAANSTLMVINWPKNGKTGRLILEVTNTGSYSLGWPNGTEWPGGSVGQVTQGANKRDIFVLTTATAGVETFGNTIGQDYQ